MTSVSLATFLAGAGVGLAVAVPINRLSGLALAGVGVVMLAKALARALH
jgi:hypothetical protein